LATWNDYLNGVLQCDNKFYFERLLTTNGFNLIDENDEVKQLSKEDVKEQKMIIVENESKCFEQFIQNTGIEDDMTCVLYREKADQLNILHRGNDVLIEHEDVIKNENVMTDYFNFSKYLKTDEYIDRKIEELKKTTYNCHLIKCYEFRIKLVREFEVINKLKQFSSDFNNINNWKLSDELYERIKISFGHRDKKPENAYEFKKYYIGLLKNLFGELGILEKKQIRKGKAREYEYSFDHNVIVKYLKLYGYTDPFYDKFDADVLKKFDIKVKSNMFY
jgi:hypothetical protein